MAKTSVTIDNLPRNVNQDFADRSRLLSDEELKKITQTSGIASRAEALISSAKQDETSNLFGLNQAINFFEEPDNLDNAIVFTERLIPSIGDIVENLEKIKDVKTTNTLEENQKDDLVNFFNNLKLNDTMASFIKSKLNEFSKG
jgi:hypothetical protein